MTPSPVQLPSPCSTEFSTLDRDSSVSPPKIKPATPAARMLKIHSLLNPSEHSSVREISRSPPPTPAYTQASSASSTPRPQTPSTPSPKRQKLVKDNAIFIRGTAKEPVIYRPSECNEDSITLSACDQQELAKQHKHFAVFPSGRGEEGFIADYQRHIPYSSDKKTFYGKTSRDAFEVFQYTFRMPGDPNGKTHVVMWDYQVGLVRITPFFKALKYSKTTPAKSLTANAGLKELSHSITGGALAAQGYWMPYSCARAICLTFCYDIRWALTPIFGPSFIKECLPPTHAGFGRFKISSEVVRCAQLEAEGWRSRGESSGSTSPASSYGAGNDGGHREIPRSVPPPPNIPQLKELRPKPTFKLGSPFESESESSDVGYTYAAAGCESPELSPKTTRKAVRDSASPTWTSINRKLATLAPPPPPHNSPVGSLSYSLLTEPHTLLPTTSWRASEEPKAFKMPTGAHDKHRVHKRRISTRLHDDADYVASASNSPSSSEQDDEDIAMSPVAKKRQRREDTPGTPSSAPSTPGSVRTGKSTKYNAADARAAQWLLNLSVRDSQLAIGPAEMEARGHKRRVSEV